MGLLCQQVVVGGLPQGLLLGSVLFRVLGQLGSRQCLQQVQSLQQGSCLQQGQDTAWPFNPCCTPPLAAASSYRLNRALTESVQSAPEPGP